VKRFIYGSLIALFALFFLRGFALCLGVMAYTWIRGFPVVFSPFSKVGMDHVDVFHLKCYSNRHDLLLTSPYVRITYDPRLFFLKRKLVASIVHIDAHQPTLILHRAETGHWKISFHFPKIDPALQTHIRIEQGHLEISDELWKVEGRPSEVIIGPIKGFLDLSNQRFAKIFLNSSDALADAIQVKGVLLRPSLAGTLGVKVANAPFAGLGDYWIHRGQFHLVQGAVDGQGALYFANRTLMSMSGSFHVHDGILVYAPYPRLKASGLECNVSIDTRIFRLSDIHGKALGMPFSGEGLIHMSGPPDFFFSSNKIPVNLESISKVFPGLSSLHPKGHGSMTVSLSGKEPNHLLEVNVETPDPSIEDKPLGHLKARVSMANGSVFIDKLFLQQSQGTLLIEGGEGYWIEAERFNLASLEPLEKFLKFSIPGKLRGVCSLSGFFVFDENHAPMLTADSTFNTVSYRGFNVNQASAKLRWSRNLGWISAGMSQGKESLAGNAAWEGDNHPYIVGQLNGSFQTIPISTTLLGTMDDAYLIDKIGFLHWNSPHHFLGKLSGANLPFHLHNRGASLAGQFSGDLYFGKKESETPWAFGLGHIAHASAIYHGLHGHNVTLFRPTDSPLLWSVGLQGNKKSFSLSSPALVSFGEIEQEKIKQLSFFLSGEGFAFKVKALGSARGNLTHPEISTDILAEGSRLNKSAYYQGDLKTDFRTIASRHSSLVWGKSSYDVGGKVSLLDGHPLDIQGGVIQGQLSDLIALTPQSPYWLDGLQGLISGKFQWSGTLEKPEGHLHFYLHEGSLWGEPIARAYTDARVKNGIFYLNPFIIRNNGDYFIARGSIGLNGPAEMTFDAPKIMLSDLMFLRRSVGVVQGTAELHGKLSGLITAPSIAGSLAVDEMRAKYLFLNRLHAILDYRKGWVDIQNAEVNSGSGRILGYVGVGLDSPVFLRTNLVFSGIDLETVSRVHALGVLGLLDGSATLDGPISGLEGNFDLKLSNERPVSGEMAGTVQNSVVDFSTLRLNVGNGELQGTGRLKVGRASTLHVEGKNLDLNVLANLLHVSHQVSGKATLSGEIRASLENPEMSIDVAIADPSFENFTATDIKGQVQYQNKTFILKDGKIDLPHGTFNLSGLIPLSMRGQTLRAPLLLHLKLDHQDLSLLSDFFPSLKAKGLLQADLQLSKRRSGLSVDGTATVSHGKLLLPMMSSAVEEINGSVSFANQQAQVGITGMLGNPFTLQGNLVLDPTQKSDLKFSGDNLHLTSPGLFDMHVTSTLDISETMGDWTAAGDTTINPATLYAEGFNPGMIREFLKKLGPLNLDDNLTFGDNVQLHHPHLELTGGGKMHFGGTGANPKISGELIGKKGTLEFLGYIFDVRKADIKFDPDQEQPYLTLVGASARRIQGSQIFVQLEGYPNDLKLSLNSYPPLSQDVLSRTLASMQPTSTYTQGNNSLFAQEEAQHWLGSGLPSEVFFPLENTLTSAFSVEEFSFQFLPTGQVGLQVGKAISPHFLITYAEPITGTQIQGQQTSGAIWGLEYHLSPRVFLELTQSNLQGFGGQVLSRWNF